MDWILLIFISAVFLGLKKVTIKKVLFEFKPLPILFVISALSTVFMVFFVQDISLSISSLAYGLIILKSLVINVAWYLLYMAYKNLEISIVAPLTNLSPIFLVILSFFVLGEQVTLLNYVGIALLVISAYALRLEGVYKFLEPFKLLKSKFFLFIIIALIGKSTSAVLDKMLLREMNYPSVLFFFFLHVSIFYFLFILYRGETNEITELFVKTKYWFLTFLIAVLAFLADVFYFIAVAIPTTYIVLIIPLRNTANLIATVIGGKLFKEGNVLYKSVVCLVMLFGVGLVVL